MFSAIGASLICSTSALEGHVGIGIDGEADAIVARHLADIRLVYLRLDLHTGEVLGDGEELRRRHAGRNGLARLDGALDHHAVDRRADIGALQVDARGVERRLALLERGLRVHDLRLGDGEVGGGGLLRGGRGIEIGLRPDTFPDQLRGAGEVELGLVQIGLGALHGRFLQRHIGFGDGQARFLLAHPGGEG